MGDETTIGTHFSEDEQDGLLAEFDARFDNRSAAVKDAMRMYLAAEQAIDATGYAFPNERDKRMWVRQAILDQPRRERDRERDVDA